MKGDRIYELLALLDVELVDGPSEEEWDAIGDSPDFEDEMERERRRPVVRWVN